MGQTAAKNRKRKGQGPTPIEQTAAGYVAPPQKDGENEPADLGSYSNEFLARWEVANAWYQARIFESWLVRLCARYGIPMDGAMSAVTHLWLYVECELVDRAMHPDEFAIIDPGPRRDEDAAHHGLSVVPPPRDRSATPVSACILPGCQGTTDTGGKCKNLREYGERFCPSCRAAERKRLRQNAAR